MARPKKKQVRFARDFENMNEEEIISRVRADMTDSESYQTPFFDQFYGHYQQYRSYKDTVDTGRANLFIPYSFHLVETQTPKVVNALINTRPFVQTVAMGVASAEREQKSKKMNMLLDYQFQMRMRFPIIMMDVVKTALIYGTAITRQGWDYRTRDARYRIPVTEYGVRTGDYETAEANVVVKDDPFCRLVPLYDFFFDPTGVDIETCRYCVEREWMDVNQLEELSESMGVEFAHMKDIREVQSRKMQAPDSNLSRIGAAPTPTNANRPLEVLHYFTDEWRLLVVNREFVCVSEMNPYFHGKKPFARFVDTPVPGEFYGIGEMESVGDLQDELNTTRNQRIDNVSLILNKMYTVLRSANIDPAQIVSRSGGIIDVDDHDDIREMKFTDVTTSAYNEETQIKRDMDIVTGVHDTERGSSPSRRETATTMNILASAGGERFKLKVALIAYGGLHEVIQQVIQLNQQYLTSEREVALLGTDGTTLSDTVTVDEVLGQFDIIGVGSAIEPSINKDIQQSNLTQLYSLLKDNPLINQEKLVSSIFEVFGFKNVAQYVNQPQMQPAPEQPAEQADLSMNPMLAQGMAQTANEAGMPMNLGGMA